MSVNVINLHDKRWKNPGGITVRIDRKTIFGNPFVIGQDGTRDDVVRKYRQHMYDEYAENPEYQRKMNSLAVLVKCRTVHLACWCVPEACHGDEIVKFVLHLNSVAEAS